MVVVDVRDQHGVDAPHGIGRDLPHAAQVQDAGPEQRVGQQSHAGQVDADGRVPDVIDLRARGGPDHRAIVGHRAVRSQAVTLGMAVRFEE